MALLEGVWPIGSKALVLELLSFSVDSGRPEAVCRNCNDGVALRGLGTWRSLEIATLGRAGQARKGIRAGPKAGSEEDYMEVVFDKVASAPGGMGGPGSGFTDYFGLNVTLPNPAAILNLVNGGNLPSSFTFSIGRFEGLDLTTGVFTLGSYIAVGAGAGTPSLGVSVEHGNISLPPGIAMEGRLIESGVSLGSVEAGIVLDPQSNQPVGREMSLGVNIAPGDVQSFVETTYAFGRRSVDLGGLGSQW
jgi:hypothetical protein